MVPVNDGTCCVRRSAARSARSQAPPLQRFRAPSPPRIGSVRHTCHDPLRFPEGSRRGDSIGVHAPPTSFPYPSPTRRPVHTRSSRGDRRDALERRHVLPPSLPRSSPLIVRVTPPTSHEHPTGPSPGRGALPARPAHLLARDGSARFSPLARLGRHLARRMGARADPRRSSFKLGARDGKRVVFGHTPVSDLPDGVRSLPLEALARPLGEARPSPSERWLRVRPARGLGARRSRRHRHARAAARSPKTSASVPRACAARGRRRAVVFRAVACRVYDAVRTSACCAVVQSATQDRSPGP